MYISFRCTTRWVSISVKLLSPQVKLPLSPYGVIKISLTVWVGFFFFFPNCSTSSSPLLCLCASWLFKRKIECGASPGSLWPSSLCLWSISWNQYSLDSFRKHLNILKLKEQRVFLRNRVRRNRQKTFLYLVASLWLHFSLSGWQRTHVAFLAVLCLPAPFFSLNHEGTLQN